MTGDRPLIAAYQGLICDLDGVVYRGATAVPGAIETLNRLSAEGVGLVFATNNASRPPQEVGTQLIELGLGHDGWSVVTSAQAAAAFLAGQLDPGSPVFAVGGPGVWEALTDVGLTPLRSTDLEHTTPAAIVQGLGTDVTWRDLTEVGHLARNGVTWVATNLDLTIPTPRGPAPGNGTLVSVVLHTTTVNPHLVGKPRSALFERARDSLGTAAPDTLVCGDRLDTDIAGANAAGLDSLLVLSGASSLRDLAFAAPALRPNFVAPDLIGLTRPGVRLRSQAHSVAEVAPDGTLIPPADVNPDGAVTAVIGAAWSALDAQRTVRADDAMWSALEDRLAIAAYA